MFAIIVRRDYYGNPATTRWGYEQSQRGTPKLYEKRADAMAAARELNGDVRLSHNQYAELWSVTAEGSQRFKRVIGDLTY